jgi:predicted transcriptional regulator
VLTYLYEAEEVARPKEIGKAIGESALNVGKDLHQLKERGLAEEEEEQWKITDDGREWPESSVGKEK